jgi:uncharacterized membrane protein
MVPLIIIMRILHIVFGIFWVGTTFFMVLVLTPRLRALGPAIQSPVMRAIMPAMVPLMMVGAIVTAVTGIVLTFVLRWGALDTIFVTGWGWSMIIGFIVTLAAVVIGFGIVVPAGMRQAKLAASIEGRPPTPEEGQQLGQLAARIGKLTITNAILMLIVVITMSVARSV